jgi:translation initiation factor 2 alpha subunit (eIF-2alpha)
MKDDEALGLYDCSKQETLEEVAEKVSRAFDNDNYKALMDLVKEGANWQAERMYSEEEVRNIVEQTIEKFYKHRYVETKSEMKELWFEQFKKK